MFTEKCVVYVKQRGKEFGVPQFPPGHYTEGMPSPQLLQFCLGVGSKVCAVF